MSGAKPTAAGRTDPLGLGGLLHLLKLTGAPFDKKYDTVDPETEYADVMTAAGIFDVSTLLCLSKESLLECRIPARDLSGNKLPSPKSGGMSLTATPRPSAVAKFLMAGGVYRAKVCMTGDHTIDPLSITREDQNHYALVIFDPNDPKTHSSPRIYIEERARWSKTTQPNTKSFQEFTSAAGYIRWEQLNESEITIQGLSHLVDRKCIPKDKSTT